MVSPTTLRASCSAAAVAFAWTLAVLPLSWLPTPASAQVRVSSTAPSTAVKSSARLSTGDAAVAGTIKSRTARPAAAKPPVAVKNVALGPDSVPALPKAFLSHGCLDSTHGEWLSGELAAAGSELRDRLQGPSSEARAQADDSRRLLPEGVESPGQGGSTEEVAAAQPSRCVPFASVRSPANRIESLAFLPAQPPLEAAELRRVMVVSRLDLGSAPSTRWHDLAETPAGTREVWVLATRLLAGETADQLPQRWQRDVSLLVRQMKKHAQAADTVWVRLVLHDEGEAARVAAVELVDEGSGQAIDSAIWLGRHDGPGGFVSARGGDHERVLWQSPVDYRRISRGVGAATVSVRKRVLAKPKDPGGAPRMVIRSFRQRGQHQGIDFAAPMGTPVVTVAQGTVVHAGKSGGYGNLVVVDHGGGITTYYAHLSAYGAGVQEGARVERGQEIGLVGSTGMSTGPHLHYEIRKDGRYLDPADPAQALPNWGLAADEHEAVLTRLLSLSLSRGHAFARATRAPALAAAPQTAVSE